MKQERDPLAGQAESLFRAFEKTHDFSKVFEGVPAPVCSETTNSDKALINVRKKIELKFINDFDSEMNNEDISLPYDRAKHLSGFFEDWKVNMNSNSNNMKRKALESITLQSIRIRALDELDALDGERSKKKLLGKVARVNESIGRRMRKMVSVLDLAVGFRGPRGQQLEFRDGGADS